MNQRNYLSVASAVVFGWLTSSSTLTHAAASHNTTPAIQQKAVQYVEDSAITLAVKNKLLQDKKIQNSDISVKTTKGCVLLTGVVDTTTQFDYVGQQVAKITGVRQVNNQLSVKKGQQRFTRKDQPQTLSEYSADALITAKVKAKLITDKRLSASDITVVTTQGLVSLTGILETQQQIDAAVKLARSVKDVKRVDNQLQLKGKEKA